MVKEGGFDLELKPLEFTTLLDQQDQGKFQVLQLGWSGRVDPDSNITNFVGTQGSQNVAGYSNPEVDKLIEEQQRTADPKKRVTILQQAGRLLMDDAPFVPLYTLSEIYGVARNVIWKGTPDNRILAVEMKIRG